MKEMITKARIKHKIDKMPNEFLDKVYRYIHTLVSTKRKQLHTYKLKGQFDDINIQAKAYE